MIWYILCTTIALFFHVPGENWTGEVPSKIIPVIIIGTYDIYYNIYGAPFADSSSGINRYQPQKPDVPFEASLVTNRQNITYLRPTSDRYNGIGDLDINSSSIGVKPPEMDWLKIHIIVVTPDKKESITSSRFLCSHPSIAFKNMIAALKGIRINRDAFIEDPYTVTIFYCNDTSVSNLQILSIISKGSFYKAIAHSGTMTVPYDNLRNAFNDTETLGTLMMVIADCLELFLKSPYPVTAKTQNSSIKYWLSRMKILRAYPNFDTDVEKNEFTEQIKEFYFLDNVSEKDIYLKLIGDNTMFIFNFKESHIYALTRNASIYLYLKIWKTKKNYKACTVYDLTIEDMPVDRWTNFNILGRSSSETLNAEWNPRKTTYIARIRNTDRAKKKKGVSPDIVQKDPYSERKAILQDIDDTYTLDARNRITHRVFNKDTVKVSVNDIKNNQSEGENTEDIDNIYKEFNKTDEYRVSTSTILVYTLVILSLLSIVNNLEISEIML